MATIDDYIALILAAKVYELAKETPLSVLHSFSEKYHNKVLLKREDLQHTYCFKLRGAYNKIANLSAAEKHKGIITASAGNHAQGVAFSARHLGLKAVVVMPVTAPQIKIDAVKSYGAQVILHGDYLAAAFKKSQDLLSEKGYVYVHPFDDPHIIAGQATVACEILRQYPQQIDVIFVPVGGGGLISGIAAYVKYINPAVKIIGVEPEDSASMQVAFKNNKPVALDSVGLFADGLAVSQVGAHGFNLAKNMIDDIITVSRDETCAAIKDIFNDTRAIAEPSGATSLAGLKKYIKHNNLRDKTLIAINTGANISFDRLQYITECAAVGSHTECLLAITITNEMGSCYNLCKILQNRNITEFNYRINLKSTVILVGMSIKGGGGDEKQIIEQLKQHNYLVASMTNNSIATQHLRHMVGGRNTSIDNEILFSLSFPNRPKALVYFLENLVAHNLDISLLHYRDHGVSYGQVLVGFQIKHADKDQLKSVLDTIGYAYTDESDNMACKMLLAQ